MKILLTIFIILISNPIIADLKLKIDHHGNVVSPINLDKNQITLKEVEFDEELMFSSELIKQHVKRVSEIIPMHTFVVLYGDKDGVVVLPEKIAVESIKIMGEREDIERIVKEKLSKFLKFDPVPEINTAVFTFLPEKLFI